MLLWCLMGFLAAFGAGCMALVLAGFFLYRGVSGEVLCFGKLNDRIVLAHALAWLKGIGILQCKILVLSEDLREADCCELDKKGITLIDREGFARSWIGAENDGTGNGDTPGDD